MTTQAERDLLTLLERMQGAGREYTDIKELAERLRRPPSEIIQVFQVYNIQIRTWSEPSAYRVADILESCNWREVSAPYQRTVPLCRHGVHILYCGKGCNSLEEREGEAE